MKDQKINNLSVSRSNNQYFFQKNMIKTIVIVVMACLCHYILPDQIDHLFETPCVQAQEITMPQGYREVKTNTFDSNSEKAKYDSIFYYWNITATQKTAIFGFYVQSSLGVSTLLMNSTEWKQWRDVEYERWRISPSYSFDFVSDDLKSYMCKSPVGTCDKNLVRFPGRELYVVIIPRQEDTNASYTMYDNLHLNVSNSATLLRDPVEGYVNGATASDLIQPSESETNIPTVSANSTIIVQMTPTMTSGIESTSTDQSSLDDIDDDNNSNSSTFYIIFGIIVVVIVAVVATLTWFVLKRRQKILAEKSAASSEAAHANDKNMTAITVGTGAAATAGKMKKVYIPHHTMKRVAYTYKSPDAIFECNDILEIIERYKDGWAKVINTSDGKEYIIPLIILEGDTEEDVSNIPLATDVDIGQHVPINPTPESLLSCNYISQPDYEEMKRAEDWAKKVRLMKRGKPESFREASFDNIKVSDEAINTEEAAAASIKHNPHHFQRPAIPSVSTAASNLEMVNEGELISSPSHSSVNIDQTEITNSTSISGTSFDEQKRRRKAIKSMVATLELENSNTELLLADHMLETFNEEEDLQEDDHSDTNLKNH